MINALEATINDPRHFLPISCIVSVLVSLSFASKRNNSSSNVTSALKLITELCHYVRDLSKKRIYILLPTMLTHEGYVVNLS